MVTRRCTQRQHLLRPDKETNNAFIYCLAIAAHRYDIEVVNFIQMSNHLHNVIFDRHGNAPAFYEHFHKLLAKCMNALRGRWENFFSSEQVSVVRLETYEALIDKLTYVATNPVAAGLVERASDWPGASGLAALTTGKPLRARRPEHFFAEDSALPEVVELTLRVPWELGEHDRVVDDVVARVARAEHMLAEKRKITGSTVQGRYAVLRKSWRDVPDTREPRRTLNPRFAARNLGARLDAIQRFRDFVRDYRIARKALLAGEPTVFPYGTYWLRRHVAVDMMPLEKLN